MIPKVNGIPTPSSERDQPHSSARLLPIGADDAPQTTQPERPAIGGLFFANLATGAAWRLDCTKQRDQRA